MATHAMSLLASAASKVAMSKLILPSGTASLLTFNFPISCIISKCDVETDLRSSGSV